METNQGGFMYPTEVRDRDTLYACFDRMYKDYVRSVKGLGGSDDMVFSQEDWIEMLKLLPREMLARLIYNFNQSELEVLGN